MSPDEVMQAAYELTMAQAMVRPMTADEIESYMRDVARRMLEVQGMVKGALASETAVSGVVEKAAAPAAASQKGIGERRIVCLECGKPFNELSKAHLQGHGLSPNDYRKKWGMDPTQPLMSLCLQKRKRDERKRKIAELVQLERKRT